MSVSEAAEAGDDGFGVGRVDHDGHLLQAGSGQARADEGTQIALQLPGMDGEGKGPARSGPYKLDGPDELARQLEASFRGAGQGIGFEIEVQAPEGKGGHLVDEGHQFLTAFREDPGRVAHEEIDVDGAAPRRLEESQKTFSPPSLRKEAIWSPLKDRSIRLKPPSRKASSASARRELSRKGRASQT